MHNPTNYYLFSLAISDIIALILGWSRIKSLLELYLLYQGLPMELYQSLDFAYPYRFSEEVCKARAFLIEFTSYASIMIICCFSFERWLAIWYVSLSGLINITCFQLSPPHETVLNSLESQLPYHSRLADIFSLCSSNGIPSED